ncbi:protein STRUBBELIG-RECEPTOR FAMILY 3-like isoform X2 [Magnolia sinica]|uniref:protein STRUBBELIG-RECEPTOR FAMILY 3-like isoform X2 n=1 Tax=Magnolia sinica TaxID=86752 RepID=UPI002658A204|nr:protein STRUBBELIG-RECEPTOR FAMILY 3-like isoform X2 [Magnolia sinica]
MVSKRLLMDGANMKISVLVFSCFILIFALPYSDGYTYEQDVYAINHLFASLGSPPLPGWIADGGDPCMEGWQGVLCVNSNITAIIVNGANLGGALGDKLGNFSSIISIDLSNNHIGGRIPYNLPSTIRSFFLSDNRLNGSIPDSLSTLSLLSDLSLNGNLLSGELPDAFQDLTGLINLDLSFNNLSGQLPPSLGNLSSLTTLHMQNNQLSGTLNILQDLPLIDLNIENNLFWGPMPSKLLSIPNFKKDGNPFNTTVLPSPPLPAPSPSPLSEAPPAPEPTRGDSINSPSTQYGPQPKRSRQNNVSIAIVAVAVVLCIVAVLLFIWLRTCCKRKLEVTQKTAERLGNDAYKRPYCNLKGNASVIQQTNQLEKDLLQSVAVRKEVIQKSKEECKIDITRREFILMPPLDEKVKVNTIAPTKSGKALNPITSVTSFTIASLQDFTNSFDEENLIGGKTLCKVYLAEHPKGRLLAVKKLNGFRMLRTDSAFLSFVSSISELQHVNIVKLVGYCGDYEQRILVYDYCSNGNLENALHSSNEIKKKLSWDARIQIALGAARALEYLHEVCQPPVMHYNFTSANLLLDDELAVHVSECGLAPLILSDSIRGMSGHVQSSVVYGAPEFTQSGTYTCQSDIYSFGIVMLELLTGRKAHDKSQPYAEQSLVKWAYSRLHDIESLLRMADPSLNPTQMKKSLSNFADIICLCIQPEPEFRPPISEIVRKLQMMMPLESR